MIANVDPERIDILNTRKAHMDQLWRMKLIRDSTYLRSLFILGYLPDEANVELNLLKLEKKA